MGNGNNGFHFTNVLNSFAFPSKLYFTLGTHLPMGNLNLYIGNVKKGQRESQFWVLYIQIGYAAS